MEVTGKKKACPTFAHEKIKKNQKPNENTAKIHIGSILECPKVGHVFFSSYLQILCTTRFRKLQHVLFWADRHHTMFFCMGFALTSFFWKYFFFEKSLRILADIAICPKSRNFGPKNRSFAKSVPKKFGEKNFLEKRTCAIFHTDTLIRF